MGAEGPLQVVWHDGPPWSEDEDLQSPVVVSSRHKKHKSSGGDTGHGRGRGQGEESEESEEDADHGSTAPRADRRGQGRGRSGAAEGETYYANEGETTADGPGGEFVTRPTGPGQGSTLATYNTPGQRDSHFAALLPNRSYNNQSAGMPFETEDDLPSARVDQRNESRYSRDYQFTIASPDEEMHGKAVALFDFARENENELPLVEGQVIWVSYRYGQGWLVAEDPKTQESGLVPEEYVRLLRDIRGGWGSLTGELTEAMMSPRQGGGEAGTPTQADPQPDLSSPTASNGSNGFPHPPVVSVFSTSSKDLDPYPHHLLGTQQGQTPPQVVHYHGQRGGSQTNTPTLSGSNDAFAQPSGGKARGNLADVSNGAAVGEKEHGKETKETKIVAGDAR
ncbi:MAG: HOG (high osmolarity glycerol) pathway protein [Thelocarpon impressellum]|nr:MAG: HOG (high osmolarity glycerol) pathway protein [Thelocarpon impressellum]